MPDINIPDEELTQLLNNEFIGGEHEKIDATATDQCTACRLIEEDPQACLDCPVKHELHN